MDQPSPFIFLSHSGADSDAARDLKRRLLESPDARAAGLGVWFDKDDLRPGASWQPQIEQAIANATAFVVYVGSKGVMNWVEAEVRVALSRANTNKDFLFIPALAADSAGSSALPSFAKLYQGVRDPLGDGKELAKLLKAVLKSDWDKAPKIIDEPFVGLRSMREEEADRFFGREKEIAALVEKFRRHRIVAIVADSGTGKSSLAEAGFIPAFRGGALADLSRGDPGDRVWHAVTMRPGANPEEGLRTGITEAAEALRQSPEARAGLRKRVTVTDPSETAFALQCDLPARHTATLLIVDQFEELFTATPDALAGPFVKLLLDLADGDKDIRILLTVRADYFNLVSDIKDGTGQAVRGADGKTLFERLNANGGDAILRLKRISDEVLSDIVCKPLRLAGVSDDQTALAKAVQSDISDQPSDLPLLQVALKAAWQERKTAGRSMLDAYQSVGGVRRALADEAEKARNKLSADEQAHLESIFVRLVRPGDTGGATRRTASLDEFDEARRELIQKLGRDEYGRLVAVSEKTAEIAHEALITQWPWLQGRLKSDARDVRRLERLMDRSREWREAPEQRRDSFFAFGAERELFAELARLRPDWLSRLDCSFVEASNESHQVELDRQRDELDKQRKVFLAARFNESLALTALASLEANNRPVNAAKLALAAWPRAIHDTTTPKLAVTLDVLKRIVPNLGEVRILERAGTFGTFSPDGTLIATAFYSNDTQLLDASSGVEVLALKGHEGPVNSAAFSGDGTLIITASSDATARLWDAVSGRELLALRGHKDQVNSAAFSPDGARVVTASEDGTARVWDAQSGREIGAPKAHRSSVRSAAFSPDGLRVVTASEDKTARLWDTKPGQSFWSLAVTRLRKLAMRLRKLVVRPWKGDFGADAETVLSHDEAVYSAAFSPDGARIVTASGDKTARLWDAASGRELGALRGHEDQVNSAVFSPDGARILTASEDKTARLWDAMSGREIAALKGHEDKVHSAVFSPGGAHVLTTSAARTRLWDVSWCSQIAALRGHSNRISSVAFRPDGARIVTASWDKTARLWDAASGREIAMLQGHEDLVFSAVFSPDGAHILTASGDKTARLWNGTSGREMAVLEGHQGPVYSAVFGPDGTRIVTGSADNTAKIWDGASGQEITTLKGHENRVNSAVFGPGGTRVVTASFDNTVRLWDVASGRFVALMRHDNWVTSAAFSSDGMRILTASYDETARLWDVVSRKEIAVLRGHEGPVVSAAFSPDETCVVTASDDTTARLWDAISGRAIVTLKGHARGVTAAVFSPDGTRLVTTSKDETVRIWDATSGREIATLKGHSREITAAAFSTNGTRIVTASEEGEARIWDVGTIPRGNILQVACALLKRHEDPVSLVGVTAYPLTFDRPICVTDPPPPNPTIASDVPVAAQ